MPMQEGRLYRRKRKWARGSGCTKEVGTEWKEGVKVGGWFWFFCVRHMRRCILHLFIFRVRLTELSSRRSQQSISRPACVIYVHSTNKKKLFISKKKNVKKSERKKEEERSRSSIESCCHRQRLMKNFLHFFFGFFLLHLSFIFIK